MNKVLFQKNKIGYFSNFFYAVGLDFYLNFLAGTLAAITATTCIQPVDMVKVRIQLASEAGGSTSPVAVAGEVYRTKGLRGFYTGYDSAVLR